MPPATGQDLVALEKSIAEGFMGSHPITVARDGDSEYRVIDGRTFFAVCRKLGVEPAFVEFAGTEAEAVDFIWRENGARRHLTKSALAILRSAAQPELSAGELAEAAGVSTRTATKARRAAKSPKAVKAAKEGGPVDKRMNPSEFDADDAGISSADRPRNDRDAKVARARANADTAKPD